MENARHLEIKECKEKYNEVMDAPAANAYDAVYLAALAASKCDDLSDADCIKEELYKIKNYNGASGVKTFDLNGDTSDDFEMTRIVEGEYEVVK